MADFYVKPGDSVSFAKTVGESDVYLFAGITGDLSVNHVNEQYMARSKYGRRIAHGVRRPRRTSSQVSSGEMTSTATSTPITSSTSWSADSPCSHSIMRTSCRSGGVDSAPPYCL